MALYNGTDWELYQSVFATVADLLAFGELIGSGAIAIVGTGIETDPAYYYDTATLQWLRMPDGVHYIWQQRSDWLDLGTIPAPQNNDRVFVQTLGTAHSSGFAERHGGTWKLVQGRFATVADMVAFSNPVHAGAFAEVKSGGGHDDDSVTYVYQSGSWVRYAALTAGFAWTLSSLDDFSAVGLQDGDYGVFTPSGGLPIVLRYKAAVTRVVAAGDGFVPAWLPPEVYAGTPTLQAYLVGTESVTTDATLNAQGWGVVSRTNGTITSQTTRVRLATTAASGLAAIDTLTSGVTATTRIYARLLWRAAVGNGTTTASTGVYIGQLRDGANGIQASYFSAATASGTFFWTGSGTVNGGISQTSQAAIPGLTGTDNLIENYYDGTTNVSELRRNGITTASSLRNIVDGAADRFRLVAWSGSAATQTSTMDISQVQVFTW